MKNWLNFFNNQTPQTPENQYENAGNPVDASNSSSQPVNNPKPDEQDERIANEVRYIIARVLNCHEPKPEEQLAKRLRGMADLADFGLKASPAIPDLIRKLFTSNTEERDQATATLTAIDNAWAQSDFAKEMIPYLTGKLDKEQRESQKAREILTQMGKNAHPALLEIVSNNDSDPSRRAYSLMILNTAAIEPDTLLAPVQNILEQAKSQFLLESALKTAACFGFKDEKTDALLTGFLTSTNTQLKVKALNALQKCSLNENTCLPHLIPCLSENDEDIRQAAISWVSQIRTAPVEDLLVQIVAKHGKMDEEEWKGIFDKLNFWLGGKEIPGYSFDARQINRNLSWYSLEFQKDMKRPELLLTSALEVLAHQGYSKPGLAADLIDIFQKSDNKAIKQQSIHVLGNLSGGHEAILPFLVSCLSHPSEAVRNATVHALQKLAPDWLTRPDLQPYVRALIETLDSSSSASGKSALLTIGDDTAGVLARYLRESENVTLQLAIIEVLKKLNTASSVSVAVIADIREACNNARTVLALNELIKAMEDQ